ncbi:MAG TPA: phosphotriesterase-related protein [Candidatus Bathyarchaeia archaeon]|nr:phosphotriesterase-related protein [Candidatus Bathyarchaeia archaeon]
MKVQTVTGEITPDELGFTLPHEHLVFDLSCYFTMPEELKRQHALSPVSMSNLGEIRRDPFFCKDSLINNDVELAIKELLHYTKTGGKSLVDLTNIGICMDPSALKAISLRTGINIISGCGFYIAASHPQRLRSMNEDQIADEIAKDVTTGIAGTDVKAGIIGEIGTSWPMESSEEKVLRGAARAHRKTKAAINIHTTIHTYYNKPPTSGTGEVSWAKSVHKILDIMEEEGVELSNVVLSHMDESIDLDAHRSLAKRGAYIEYDTFGSEFYFDHIDSYETRDTERIQAVLAMIKSGYLSQMLLSHEVCQKISFKTYGGWGFDHISTHILPMLRNRGITQEQIDEMTIENPKRILAF